MLCVLGLFEGVVTGAADGYYRMSDKPAATLLHLGPGLANGLANIHNANRAMSAAFCLCIGLRLASSLIILCAPWVVREPVSAAERTSVG
jgi:hypothetical protein